MNIIELARQAGFVNIGGGIRDNGEISDYWDCWPEQLERFAALIRQEERERCAKMCASHPELAAAIRGVK